jgi:hypothetical protein
MKHLAARFRLGLLDPLSAGERIVRVSTVEYELDVLKALFH